VNRALIVCGASGVGKSSVAAKISQVLAATGVPSAFIDVDAIAQFGPAPWDRREGVSFHDTLKCKNVGSLWLNFRDAGALNLIVAAHVDSLELREQYQRALEGCALQVALLTAHPDHLKERLTGRPPDPFHPMTYAEDGTVRQEVFERVPAEQTRLQAAEVHDFSVANNTSPAQTAARVLELAGWLNTDHSPGATPSAPPPRKS
jgi:broad-specificity NMP kinase